MPNPSTYKRLIRSSLMVVIILAVLLSLKYDLQIKKFVRRHTGIDTTDHSENQYYQKQDSLKVDFEGLKNDTIQISGEIIKVIATELEGFNWNEEFKTEDLYSLYHETIFAQQFPSGLVPSGKLIIVTFSNYTGNFSHASAGRLSLFKFWKEHQSWEMISNHLAFGYGDEYGLEPHKCDLVQIGINNRYGLVVHTSYSGNGGHEKQSQLLYTEINQELKLVFDFTSYEYYFDYPQDIEYTDGYSEMRIVKSNKNFFDIETKSEEIKWTDKTPGAVKCFVFDGEEYVESKLNINKETNN
jgi:hypothetical protein